MKSDPCSQSLSICAGMPSVEGGCQETVTLENPRNTQPKNQLKVPTEHITLDHTSQYYHIPGSQNP